MRPAARNVERVSRPSVMSCDRRGPASPAPARPALVLQRRLDDRLVDAPALVTADLQHEHVVRVVMHGEALRGGRRAGTRSPARESRDASQGRGSRARPPAPSDAAPAGRASRPRRARRPPAPRRDLREAARPPGDVLRVVAGRERRAVLDQPESRHPDRRSRRRAARRRRRRGGPSKRSPSSAR